MGCRASRPREAGDEAGQRTEKEQIHSTLNALKKHSTHSTTTTTTPVSSRVTSPKSGLELIRAWSGEPSKKGSMEDDGKGRNGEEGDAATSDFLIAKMLFEEEEEEEKHRKLDEESDFLLAQSLNEVEEEEEEERRQHENESYEELLKRWKRMVGSERIESWSRRLDGVVREKVSTSTSSRRGGSSVKRQKSIPITPKRNQDEDLRIALQLSRKDSEKVERDHDVLLQRLDALGLREKVVSGDGNCQFRALSDQLFRTPEYYKDVRKNVVGQLRKHASRYAAYVVAVDEADVDGEENNNGDSSRSRSGSKNATSSSQSSTEVNKSAFFMMQTAYSNYCDDMSLDSTWGDHVTLQAAADFYGAQITVVTSYSDNGVLEITPIRTSYFNNCGNDSPPDDDGKNSSWSEKFGERNLWLSFWAEVHYNSIYPKLEFHAPESGKKSGGKGGAGYYKNDENVDDSTNTDTNNTKTSSRGAKGLSSRTAIRSQAYEQNAAALRIQTSFRGAQARKKVINSRRLLQRSLETLKIHNAASIIQRAYRVHRAERIEREELEEYENVMRRIASNTPEKSYCSPEFYSSPLRNLQNLPQRELFKSPQTPEERKRDFLEHQRAFEKRRAAIKIQKFFRGVLEKKRMLDASNDPAKKLQALVRAEMALNAYREMKSRQTNAAVKMQALVRGAIGRKRLKEANDAATKIQSMVKMHAAKKDLREMKAKRLESANKLQALMRGVMARKRLKEANDAATKIQSLVKMQKAKKTMRELHIKRNESALKLQAMMRGVLARKRLADANQAAIKIQSMVKMQKAKKEFQDLQERRRQSALKFQAFTRGVIARKKFNETKSSAIKIQSAIKMAKERDRFQRHRQATLVIQARVRAAIEGRREREKFREKRNAILKMQSLLRMAIEKKRYQETKDAVTKMQSIARMKLARQEFELLKKQHASAKKLQAIYRGQLVRKRQNELSRRAVVIQSTFRGYQTRKKYNLQSHYVGWEAANKTTWSGNSSSDEEDVEWTREYYLKSYAHKNAIEEHHENMVKAGILPPKTSEPFSPRTSSAFNIGLEDTLESYPAPKSPSRRRKKRNWSRRLIGRRRRRRNGGDDGFDGSSDKDDSAAEKEFQEPTSVLIKSISKRSGHPVLVRKSIDLEASLAMKKKLAFEFDEQTGKEKMEKEKKRGGKSKPQRLLGALRSAFVDKPAKMAQATVSIVTSKHAVELFLRCAVAFFAFDAVKTVQTNHRKRIRRYRFGREEKPILVIKTAESTKNQSSSSSSGRPNTKAVLPSDALFPDYVSTKKRRRERGGKTQTK